MMFAVAFGWIVFLTAVMPWPQLTREEVHSELGKLYKPFILIIGISWILMRFPRLAFPREFLPKPKAVIVSPPCIVKKKHNLLGIWHIARKYDLLFANREYGIST